MGKCLVPLCFCTILIGLSGCREQDTTESQSAQTAEPQLPMLTTATGPEAHLGEAMPNLSQSPESRRDPASEVVSGQSARLGRDDYGQDLEISYDGIPMGCSLADVAGYLNKIPNIQRTKEGPPLFERVPTKTYYRYYVDRDVAGEEGQSEVALFFKDGRLIQTKDVFGGFYETVEEANRRFESIAGASSKTWGDPESRSSDRVTWVRNDIIAVLAMELPTDSIGLPIITLLIWEQ